jgi:site-specific DNA-methyltransferase (adenine-specific)
VAANVLAHGTGALNIGATRIGTSDNLNGGAYSPESEAGHIRRWEGGEFVRKPGQYEQPAGRWPPNLLLTDPIFDGGVPGVVGGGEAGGSGPASGPTWSGPSGSPSRAAFNGMGDREPQFYGDSGTYSRFFLVPKSSRSDREPLLRGTLAKEEGGAYANGKGMPGRTMIDGQWVQTGTWEEPNRKARENAHPTVKPLELMRHLVRLVTPPGGTVLDCFLGSGTTAIAANAEGFRAIGIEREKEYLDIAVARLAHQPVGMAL